MGETLNPLKQFQLLVCQAIRRMNESLWELQAVRGNGALRRVAERKAAPVTVDTVVVGEKESGYKCRLNGNNCSNKL